MFGKKKEQPAIQPSIDDQTQNELEDVYLMWPRMYGLANEMLVQTEKGRALYRIHSKVFSPLGRKYTVYDTNMQILASTKQDTTAIFPRHTLYLKDKVVGKLGQEGLIPQNYFIAMNRWPRLTFSIRIFDSIYQVRSEKEVIAEVAQTRSRWIVAVLANVDRLLLLSSLAIIYRENTIGG